MVKPLKKILTAFCVFVIVVCLLTAFAVGAVVIINDAGIFVRNNKTYYAVGKPFEQAQNARGEALSVKNVGGAGYVYKNESGYFVIYAVYMSATEANAVAQNIDADTFEIDVKPFRSEGKVFELLIETLNDSISLWQEYDKEMTSASYVSTALRAKATEIGAYSGNDGLKTLCSEVSVMLLMTASSGDYSLSSDLKNFSAYLALRLRDFSYA